MLKITDASNFRRTLTGLCLIAAPLVLFVGFLVHPGEGEAGLVQTIADYPGRVEVANLAIIISSMLFVPALIGLLRPIRGRGVALTHIGVGLALVGAISHAVWAGMQVLLVGMVQSGIDRAQLSAMAEVGPPNAGSVVVMLMFLVGFSLGLIVLAVGLWRSQAFPRWSAICIVLVPLFDFLPIDNKLLFAVGPVLAIVGFGAIGLRVLTMSDAEWERGHTPSTGEVGLGAQPRVQ